MEAGFIVFSTVMMVVGIVIGWLIGRFLKKTNTTHGIIYVFYNSEDNKPSLLLEPNVPIDDIASQKRVSLDVMVLQ